jgi:hypothetical protein
MAQTEQQRRAATDEPLTRKSPDFQGFFYAPEWTRTTTDQAVHKALNLARLPIPPQAQRWRV